MAAKTTPKGSNIYQPFIGFTYKDASGNMWHSFTDLKIYRTSNGNRYNESLTATMTDKVVDVPGGDGQYYFGTTFKNRTFMVDYAFDELTKTEIDTIKMVFSGDGIHELVFDEDRDNSGTALKIWSAKVTGTATMKHLCFEENGQDVYKGEGSITFTCYYPYARSENKGHSFTPPGGHTGPSREDYIQNGGDIAAPFRVRLSFDYKTGAPKPNGDYPYLYGISHASESGEVMEHAVRFATPKYLNSGKVTYEWDSKIGLVWEISADGNKTLVPLQSGGIYSIPPEKYLIRNAIPFRSGTSSSPGGGNFYIIEECEFYELYR